MELEDLANISKPCFRVPGVDDAPQSIKVFNNSLVRFSKRLNFDIGCNMDFQWFPVDLQGCMVKFESFGYQISVSIHTPFKQRRGLTLALDL